MLYLIPNAAPLREYNHAHDPRGRFAGGARIGAPALQARSKMPQLGGHTPPSHFRGYLAQRGIATTRQKVNASTLTPTQNQMVAKTVRAMVQNRAFDPGKKPIFISQSGGIIDGHHRWAAVIARAKQSGTAPMMNVIRVHAPTGRVLAHARVFGKQRGIARKAA